MSCYELDQELNCVAQEERFYLRHRLANAFGDTEDCESALAHHWQVAALMDAETYLRDTQRPAIRQTLSCLLYI